MSGNVYAFSTQSKYKTLKTLRSESNGGNVFRYLYNNEEIGVILKHPRYKILYIEMEQ